MRAVPRNRTTIRALLQCQPYANAGAHTNARQTPRGEPACFHGSMRITRREVLAGAGAGAAWLALHAGRAGAMPPEPSIPDAMGRGIDLTPQGLRAPGSPQDYTVLRAQPWA